MVGKIEGEGRMSDYAPPKVGDIVKVRFEIDPPIDGCSAERMWVRVTMVSDSTATGMLDNNPLVISDMKIGDKVVFDLADILGIWESDPR